MKGISICVASGKGGVGKSTICVNLGIALSQLNVKTIIVDADVEGASIGLIAGVDFNVPTLHDYLSGKTDMNNAILKLKNDSGTTLVVGSIRVEALEDIRFDLFKGIINELIEKYEIVLVDIPAGLGIDSVTAISACDTMLLITTPDTLSITNALKVKAIARGLGCRILGILVNKYGSSKYDLPPKYIEYLSNLKIVGMVEEDEDVKKSLLEGKPLLFQNPDSPASIAIKKLASRLIR